MRQWGGAGRSLLYLLAVYAITVPGALVENQVAPSGDLLAVLKLACLAAFIWHAAAVLGGRRSERASALALAAATGLVWAALAAIALYKRVALLPFDFLGVLASLGDASRTLVAVLGEHGVALTLASLGALAIAAIGAARLLGRGLRAGLARFAPGRLGTVVCVGLLSYLAAADLWYATSELVLYGRWSERPFDTPRAIVPDYSAGAIASRESVFIVQLESVNSRAVFGRIPQPGLETILQEGAGVLFPLFWANGAQTDRAWESILCAVSGNVGASFSRDPSRLGRHSCLPARLAAAGYATVFLYSYFEVDFFNLGGFAQRAGFQELAFGPQLMAEGDRRHVWAYDDCVFYGRAFDYLARRGLDARERVFAYFEVGMNHAPFRGTMKYPEAHPYRAPASTAEHYLNSVAEQDHCLLEFWRRFRGLGRDDIHLFIVPDHGVLVPGASQEPDPTFATWLAYVPPARRRAEFKARAVLAPVPSQAQLYPTILELLSGEAAPASFAFALRGEQVPRRYEDCHVLGEPAYGVVVLRDGQRAEYRYRSGEALTPAGERVAMGLRAFQERFGCK